MEITAKRLLELRHSIGLSQARMAEALGISQPALNRYEHDQAVISDRVLCVCADFFDVSLDYICGRTENSEGKLYSARPKIAGDNEEMRKFIEMCFDPKSKVSVKLKDTLYQIMMGDSKNES